MKIALSLLVAALLPWHSAAWAFEDQFNSPDWSIWCPCQINMAKAPITFIREPSGNYFARIIADEASLGGNECRLGDPHFECRPPVGSSEYTLYGFDKKASPEPGPPDRPEPLGPSLIPLLKGLQQGKTKSLLPLTEDSETRYCTPDVLDRARNAGEEGECMQRQELRVQSLSGYVHRASAAYLYSLRFRMPRDIENQTDSIRWSTAQWKHEPVSEAYKKELGEKWGASPFLAQRFDDGVLHLTVQDEHCRCVVASARLPDGSNPPWLDGRARYCKSTRPGHWEDRACTPELWVAYGPNPVLSSPRGEWVEMKYRVQAGRSGDAMIEVYEGARFIARVTGKIGYDVPGAEGDCTNKKVSCTKFKVGHYRAYMPFVHAMDIDWIKVEPAPK